MIAEGWVLRQSLGLHASPQLRSPMRIVVVAITRFIMAWITNQPTPTDELIRGGGHLYFQRQWTHILAGFFSAPAQRKRSLPAFHKQQTRLHIPQGHRQCLFVRPRGRPEGVGAKDFLQGLADSFRLSSGRFFISPGI